MVAPPTSRKLVTVPVVLVTVKISEKLALSAGYGVTDNTHPPPTLRKLDTITTVNLVFAF